MAGTAEGARKARERREQKEREFRALADGRIDDLPVAADAGLMEQNQQPQQAVMSLRPLLPDAAATVSRAMNAKTCPWSAKLTAALYVLGSCGIGPQQSGKAVDAFDPSNPLSLGGDDLAAFVAAGSRALALRQASKGAQDAVIVSERPGHVTQGEKPEGNQQ